MAAKKSKRRPRWTQLELAKLKQLVKDGYTTRTIYNEMAKYHPHRANGKDPKARRTWGAIRRMIDVAAKNDLADRLQGMSTIESIVKRTGASRGLVIKAMEKYEVPTVAHLRCYETANRVGEASRMRYVDTEDAIRAVLTYLSESDSNLLGAKAYVCRFVMKGKDARSLEVSGMSRAMLRAARDAGMNVETIGKNTTGKPCGAMKARLSFEQWESVRAAGEQIFRRSEELRIARDKALVRVCASYGVRDEAALRSLLRSLPENEVSALRAEARKITAVERQRHRRSARKSSERAA